ncbi:MAG: DNA repair protein RadC [Lachnospiraceae bacterium]|nr:DNA repair protein RadC [Lachnospiraceae bacterium]
MNNLIKDIAYCERPYEKALHQDIKVLTDAELLAVILRSGTKDTSSIDLANKLLNAHITHKGLLGINHLRREDLVSIKGIGQTKATQILAIGEISYRINKMRAKENISFFSPESIAEYYMEECKFLTKERTYLMMFSTRQMLIKEVLLSQGTINQSLISPRDVFLEALKYEAVYIVLIHNHPSGNPEPSDADINITKRIKEAGRLIDIHLSDHIIVGNGTYVSMLERGII